MNPNMEPWGQGCWASPRSVPTCAATIIRVSPVKQVIGVRGIS